LFANAPADTPPDMQDASYQAWIGRAETVEDVAGGAPLRGLAALLDHEGPPWAAGQLPPLAHWLYFLPDARQSMIDVDGHPRRGGLLPPIALPRRMWAGGRLAFFEPIALGAALSRRSTIQSVVPKSGKSGDMVFVTVLHEVFADGALAVREEQDLVYRGEATGPAAAAAAPAADSARVVVPDAVLLFRFSALTFNAHRIHYDRDYARDVEGYPGLVVHGPLIATLLMDHFLRQHPGRRVAAFSFRAQRPLFDTASFTLFSETVENGAALWAAAADMPAAMTAQVEAA
jgi:3-methylfumaryl-CoA hydratase